MTILRCVYRFLRATRISLCILVTSVVMFTALVPCRVARLAGPRWDGWRGRHSAHRGPPDPHKISLPTT